MNLNIEKVVLFKIAGKRNFSSVVTTNLALLFQKLLAINIQASSLLNPEHGKNISQIFAPQHPQYSMF